MVITKNLFVRNKSYYGTIFLITGNNLVISYQFSFGIFNYFGFAITNRLSNKIRRKCIYSLRSNTI